VVSNFAEKDAVRAENSSEYVVGVGLASLVITVCKTTDKEALIVGEIVVEPRGKFVIRGDLRRERKVDKAIRIARWNVLEKLDCARTEERGIDLVIDKWRWQNDGRWFSLRVFDSQQRGKIATALSGGRRDGIVCVGGVALPRALVIHKEKELVFQEWNRAAYVTSELIAMKAIHLSAEGVCCV
jgi:hypothetical protein